MRPLRRLAALCTAGLAAAACSGVTPVPVDGAGQHLAVALPRDVRPVHYALELTLDPAADRFSGTVVIDVELQRPASELALHARDLAVRSVEVESGGEVLAATLEQVTPEGLARLRSSRVLPAGRSKVRVAFQGEVQARPQGVFRERHGQDAYLYLQAEPTDARRIFPCFDDPWFRAPFDVAVTAPSGLRVVANAPVLAEAAAGPGLQRVQFATTAPLPTALVFAAAGPFEVVQGDAVPPGPGRAQPVPLRAFVPRGEARRVRPALAATRALVQVMEEWLHTPFPYPKLDAVVATGFPGGMENAGAILYGEEVLLSARAVRAAQGGDPTEVEAEAGLVDLVAHEVAHQWFGDLVGISSWQDVWLKESFATFVGWGAQERWRPALRVPQRAAAEVEAVLEQDVLPSARALRAPVSGAADVLRQFDPPAYAKGAALLRGYERLLGPARFAEALRAYLAAHPHDTATSEQWAELLGRMAHLDLAPAFRSVLDAPGVPLVEARPVCERGLSRLELSVSREVPAGMAAPALDYGVPVCTRFEAAGALGELCALAQGPRTVLVLPACPRWVLPAAAGVGYHRWALSGPDLAHLRDAGFAHLTPVERLAYAHGLAAAVRSGRLAASEGLRALAPLARDGDEDVATAPLPLLRDAVEILVPRERQARARARAAELYRPRVRELGLAPAPGEGAATRELRVAVLGFMVRVAHDPEVTHALALRGLAYVGYPDRRPRRDAVSPELAELAVAAAVVEASEEAFEALLARAQAVTDEDERAVLLMGLAATRDPARAGRVLALAGEERIPVESRGRLVVAMASQEETREPAWRVLQKRWDELAPALFAEDEGAALPGLVAGLCDRERVEAVRKFLQRRSAEMPALARRIPDAIAALERCAALRESQGQSAAAFLAGG